MSADSFTKALKSSSAKASTEEPCIKEDDPYF
jgi:hypothetical protein